LGTPERQKSAAQDKREKRQEEIKTAAAKTENKEMND